MRRSARNVLLQGCCLLREEVRLQLRLRLRQRSVHDLHCAPNECSNDGPLDGSNGVSHRWANKLVRRILAQSDAARCCARSLNVRLLTTSHTLSLSLSFPPIVALLKSALFASGEVSAQDFEALSNEQKIAGAAALSGIVIVLLILGIIAAILIILAILATTTGIFLYKHTQDVSAHTFEGELVSGKSIPVGTECAAPAWAVETGGDGVNPLGNHRDLSRAHSFFSSLKKVSNLSLPKHGLLRTAHPMWFRTHRLPLP